MYYRTSDPVMLSSVLSLQAKLAMKDREKESVDIEEVIKEKYAQGF